MKLTRPQAVDFLDRLLREDNKLRIEDVLIPADSNLVGHTLAQCMIRKTGALVLAIRKGSNYIYNPGPDVVLEAGAHLIVIAPSTSMAGLRDGLKHDALLRDDRRRT